jgi:histidine ammonia-lyase
MTLTLTGSELTVEGVVAVARQREAVELHPGAEQRIRACREMLERKLAAGEVMYGINTGIGEFSETRLADEEIRDFQRYLVYNHAAGIGAPAPAEQVRAAMVSRVNVHARGRSGLRIEAVLALVDMLNAGVTPYVCRKGSVGASGDLAPMSQIALGAMGEGRAWYGTELLPARDALARAGLTPLVLEARDGLGLINGSNFQNGMNALQLVDIDRWLRQAEIAAAMTLEALNANMKPYDRRVHEERGFPGAVRSADAIRRCLAGSATLEAGRKRVQDAYSMRSTPQVIGAAHDAVEYAREQIEIELDGGHGRDDGECAVGAPAQPAAEPGSVRRATAVPHRATGILQRAHAEPVHGGDADRRAAHARRTGSGRVHPRGGGSRGLRQHGDEHLAQERADPGERVRGARDRVPGGCPGARHPRPADGCGGPGRA